MRDDVRDGMGIDVMKKLYRAPEVFKMKASEKCDVWSCGVMLYFLVVGRLPFRFGEDATIVECRSVIESGKYDKTNVHYKTLSAECKDLISKMIETDPEKRVSSAEAVKHPWFKQVPKIKVCQAEIKTAI